MKATGRSKDVLRLLWSLRLALTSVSFLFSVWMSVRLSTWSAVMGKAAIAVLLHTSWWNNTKQENAFFGLRRHIGRCRTEVSNAALSFRWAISFQRFSLLLTQRGLSKCGSITVCKAAHTEGTVSSARRPVLLKKSLYFNAPYNKINTIPLYLFYIFSRMPK